jgi:hypothetical protein
MIEPVTDKLNKISQHVEENDRAYRGSNFFDPEDEELLEALGSGEFYQRVPEQKTCAAVSEARIRDRSPV